MRTTHKLVTTGPILQLHASNVDITTATSDLRNPAKNVPKFIRQSKHRIFQNDANHFE